MNKANLQAPICFVYLTSQPNIFRSLEPQKESVDPRFLSATNSRMDRFCGAEIVKGMDGDSVFCLQGRNFEGPILIEVFTKTGCQKRTNVKNEK